MSIPTVLLCLLNISQPTAARGLRMCPRAPPAENQRDLAVLRRSRAGEEDSPHGANGTHLPAA